MHSFIYSPVHFLSILFFHSFVHSFFHSLIHHLHLFVYVYTYNQFVSRPVYKLLNSGFNVLQARTNSEVVERHNSTEAGVCVCVTDGRCNLEPFVVVDNLSDGYDALWNCKDRRPRSLNDYLFSLHLCVFVLW